MPDFFISNDRLLRLAGRHSVQVPVLENGHEQTFPTA
jgi:hypothetical protein